VTAITCPIGGLLAGYSLDKIGRKTTLILINIISIVSWLILSFSSTTDAETLFIQLIVARFIIGKFPLKKIILNSFNNNLNFTRYWRGNVQLPGRCVCR
jgi:Sugar (and other) transporter